MNELEIQDNYIQECRLTVGRFIRNIREQKGLSQDELAESIKVNRSTIVKIENGRFSYDLDSLSKLSWVLGFEYNFSIKNRS